jgi:hypothetical protein
MEKSNRKPVLPACMMSHEVVNKLSIIIGNCDLVIEKAPADSDCIKRLSLIGETARGIAKIMQDHQCELSDVLRPRHDIETTNPTQPLESVNDCRKKPRPVDKTKLQAKLHQAG